MHNVRVFTIIIIIIIVDPNIILLLQFTYLQDIHKNICYPRRSDMFRDYRTGRESASNSQVLYAKRYLHLTVGSYSPKQVQCARNEFVN